MSTIIGTAIDTNCSVCGLDVQATVEADHGDLVVLLLDCGHGVLEMSTRDFNEYLAD